MNHLRKEIQKLEQPVALRKKLLDDQYQQARSEFKNKLSSPATLSIAFLIGFVLFSKKKKTYTNTSMSAKPESAITPILQAASEIYGILGLVNYARSFLQKINQKTTSTKS